MHEHERRSFADALVGNLEPVRPNDLHRRNLHASRRGREALEACPQPLWVGPFAAIRRLLDGGPVEALQSHSQHRPVDLLEQTIRDVDDAVGCDAEQVPVVGKVLDCAAGYDSSPIRGPTRIVSGMSLRAYSGGSTPSRSARMRAKYRSKPAGVQTMMARAGASLWFA